MKHYFFLLVFNWSTGLLSAQQLVFPSAENWNVLKEGQPANFKLEVTDSIKPNYSLEGVNGLGILFDTLGNFSWTPSYNVADRLEKQKEISLIFQATWKDGRKIRKPVNFIILHQNRPAVVEDLPTFYVKQSTLNQYQISPDYVNDPDGDPLVFKSIPSQMPEGATLSSQGLLVWTPSRNQFNSLKNNPLQLEFLVQDQPEKAETIGKIKIAQTQLDLPPEILLVPGDSSITVKEDERVNFKMYVSDPNGDENISNVGFVCSDSKVQKTSLKENTPVQFEFTWSPGYSFVEEVGKEKMVEIVFFALDKSANRVQRKVKIKVLDAENLEEKDKLLYQKYVNSLTRAKAMIDELDKNHADLSKAYKQAKKGKKNRSILNASLGATTGLSPVILSNDPSSYKAVSAIGGTTVLTLGTLEATEVIGKSKSDILDKMKVNVEIRNQLQVEGDNFARKYALKSARREKSFDADRDKLLPILINQKLVTLELDASKPTKDRYAAKEIKKTFSDFSEE
jgi:hypothetical protein